MLAARTKTFKYVATASASASVYCSSRPDCSPRSRIPDVPFVVGDADRPVDPLDLARPLDERRANPQRPLRLVRRQHVASSSRRSRCRCGWSGSRRSAPGRRRRAVPVAPAVPAATHQFDRAVQPAQRIGPAASLGDVLLGGEMADLPVAPHLVAETPVVDVVWLGVTVGPAQIGPVGVARAVAVLDPGQRLLQRAGAHVEADVRLGVRARGSTR